MPKGGKFLTPKKIFMSIVATKMLPLINKYEKDKADKFEIPISRPGAFELFRQGAQYPNAVLSATQRAQAELSYGVDGGVKLPVFSGNDFTIGDTLSCTITGTDSDTALMVLDFVPIEFHFTMKPDQYATGTQRVNYVSEQDDFNNKFTRASEKLMQLVDNMAADKFETDKNIYWPAFVSNYYPVVGDALQISQAESEDVFNQLQSVLQEFDYYDMTYVLTSTSMNGLVRKLQNQSTGNATNLAFQFNYDNFRFQNSNRVDNGEGVQSTGYLIKPGAIDVVTRVTSAHIAGRTIGSGRYPSKQWGTVMMPRLDMKVGTFYTADCGSVAINETFTNPQSFIEGYSWYFEICFLTAYNSTRATRQNPIIKFEIQNA